jgi:hypothetical protein
MSVEAEHADSSISTSSTSTHASRAHRSSLASGVSSSEATTASHDELLASGECVDTEDLTGVVAAGVVAGALTSSSARAHTHREVISLDTEP